MPEAKAHGTLHLVATPIGNLEDMSPRALRALEACEIIAAEDTRRTRKLLTRYGISRRLLSCHEHNEAQRIPVLLDALRSGKDVALVSDAGSPGISDPGHRLVRRAAEAGIPVTALPGPSAIVLALSLSGMPADRFTFYGFLPRTPAERSRLFEEVRRVPHTLVFFESPHRLVSSMRHMAEALGQRRAVLCRELTKRFEQVERGTLAEIAEAYGGRKPRGEFCLVVEGRPREPADGEDHRDRVRQALEAVRQARGRPLKEVAREVADRLDLSRREVYQLALADEAAGDGADPDEA